LDPQKQPSLVSERQLVFPNSQHTPAPASKRTIYKSCANFVAFKLLFPKRAISFGLCAVSWAAVPKTAIHKNGQVELFENKVRFAEARLISPPASNSVPPEKACEHNLRIPIAA
jgi:hypothetical protein